MLNLLFNHTIKNLIKDTLKSGSNKKLYYIIKNYLIGMPHEK